MTGADRAAEISRLIFNDQIDAAMTLIFIVVVAIILVDSARAWIRALAGAQASPAARMESAA